MIFHFTNNFDLHNCSRDRIELVRGDSPYVVARVHGQRVIGSACFGLYDQGDFGGSALANVTQFVTVPGDDYVDYIGILALNTDALTALVGSNDNIEVAGEWEIKYADDSGNIITVTPEKVEVLVSNDYIRQSPPSPVDPEDAYATEKFVEEVLKERVAVETEAALGGIRDDAEAAATRAEEARDTTKLAESAAGVSSESARLHALSAQDSASRASGSASSAKRSELVCEDYAKLSRESATNAASSSVAAKNAAGDAQTAARRAEEVAGSLGSEVADAKQSATEAKASATNAAASAATAKTEVGKIGNSVSTAQTAATNAAASANTASGHASTATTKATQAGESASNAANLANVASGHAQTAGAKATAATGSATSAATSATQAGQSATAAANSATSASLSAEDVKAVAAEVVAMMKEIVPPRLNYNGNHFYFNRFTEPEQPDDMCVYPYAYLKKMVGGKDNYQLWLDAGNTGTLEDFLETQKGPPGDGKELEELKNQLESKTEAVWISEEDYRNIAVKNPQTIYIIN